MFVISLGKGRERVQINEGIRALLARGQDSVTRPRFRERNTTVNGLISCFRTCIQAAGNYASGIGKGNGRKRMFPPWNRLVRVLIE